MNQPDISTYNPGTLLTVGSHHAKILKYITSGGFAQVYSAEIFSTDSFVESNIVCLKRVIVPDKPSLNTLRAEVDAMKLLKNNKHVVSYIDSHAAKSPFQNGSYEVFLLMEYCAGGGLIDFMNTRLQNRLQEFEILNIMSQVTQGIAAMHALQPALLHRDIKIENVLISHNGDYKVCDFGSVCGVIRPPKNPQEFAYVQHDILKNTTAQYRSPEMIDLYRGLPIDEKSDIWALGVFLYKLCYYTTPFEKGGELAILHSRFQFPAQPLYSDRLKNLIRALLMEHPNQRPNVCQTLEEVSRIQGVACPIRNFYLMRAMKQSNETKHELHYSRTQPLLNSALIPPVVASQSHLLPAIHSLNSSAVQLAPSVSIPLIVSRPRSASNTGTNTLSRPYNHTMMANSGNFETKHGYDFKTSAASSPPTTNLSSTSTKNGRGNIQQILSSNPTSLDRPGNYVDSETQTSDTSLYKGGRPLSMPPATSSTTSLPLRQEDYRTDNSSVVRSSSLSSKKAVNKDTNVSYPPVQRKEDTFGNARFGSPDKQEEKQPNLIANDALEAFSKRHYGQQTSHYSDNVNNPSTRQINLNIKTNQEAKESIQKRVHALLTSSDDASTENTASDHSEYTVPSPKDSRAPSKMAPQGKEQIIPPVKTHTKSKLRPSPPPKPAHLRPKPPVKPAFLSAGKNKSPKKLLDESGEALMDGSREKFVRKEVAGTL